MKKRFISILAGLLLAVLTSTTAWAREFITAVKLIGADSWESWVYYRNKYTAEGWKYIDYDLNRNANGDFIYLLYYTEFNNDNPNLQYITRFWVKLGTSYPDVVEEGSMTYHLVPYDGTSRFRQLKGDLNSNCGGDYIHLYYTRDFVGDNLAVSGIYFNSNGSASEHLWADGGANCDLNRGASGDYIYMHLNLTNRAFVSTTYDLSTVKQNLILRNKDVGTGTLANPVKVSIADRAKVTLRDVNISKSNAKSQWAGITCEGDAEIILEGNNEIHGCSAGYPGIYVSEGKFLAIEGEGKLQAYCGGVADESKAAGIGGGENLPCGLIAIMGGDVEATGGKYSPGIGGGYNAGCGDIGIAETITKVVATAGPDAPNAIGAGKDGTCDSVIVSELLTDETVGSTRTIAPIPWNGDLAKVVEAYHPRHATAKDGMTITGTLSAQKQVFIADGATVTLKNAKIDRKDDTDAGIICNGNATIILEGNNELSSLSGSGLQAGGDGTTLTIKGDGKLTAKSGNAAGIGAYSTYSGRGGNVVIESGDITAIGSERGAGIGTSFSYAMGDITIQGGDITAMGGSNAPGIGASYRLCGDINITGGTVFASGGWNGISSFYLDYGVVCSNITIGDDINVVVATRGSDEYQFFNVGDKGTLTIGSAITRQEEGNTCTLMGLNFDPDGIKEIKDEDLMKNEGAIYNLSGQRLSKMQRGINIIDGRKVLK